jgi:hypothetical protein
MCKLQAAGISFAVQLHEQAAVALDLAGLLTAELSARYSRSLQGTGAGVHVNREYHWSTQGMSATASFALTCFRFYRLHDILVPGKSLAVAVLYLVTMMVLLRACRHASLLISCCVSPFQQAIAAVPQQHCLVLLRQPATGAPQQPCQPAQSQHTH